MMTEELVKMIMMWELVVGVGALIALVGVLAYSLIRDILRCER